MLRFKGLYPSGLLNSDLDARNDDLANQAIDQFGAENIIQIFKSHHTSYPNTHILVEDPSGPRSTCPGCHGFIRPEDDFCIHCGAPLKETLCPKCGHTERPGAKFCSKCGKRLVEE
ncbi:zinc ribbon domain-containing protein [Angelakisella massiliensis]|uniref:zinc ribbon domain-containing protein n=1 Tax=Angelakisella massiliensis TaxID=1871018 RepID=UPI0023A812E5|nr:zinc ribbon domain-containing protein [Angelakisella massiliensis]